MIEVKTPPTKHLSLLGCKDESESLFVLPKTFADKRFVNYKLANGPRGRICLWSAAVVAMVRKDRQGMVTNSPFPATIELTLRFRCANEVRIKIFKLDDEWRGLRTGAAITFIATLGENNWGFGFTDIELSSCTGQVHPLYTGVMGQISGQLIEQYIEKAVESKDAVRKALLVVQQNDVVRKRLQELGFTPLELLKNLHRPSTPELAEKALSAARSSAVCEVISSARAGYQASGPAHYNINEALVVLAKLQSEKLSDGQSHALNVIRRAINASSGARLLLNGDVGSGKTLVFMLAAASVCKSSGGRSIIMVPSEIVANQVFAQAVKRFPDLNPLLVTGTSNQKPTTQNRLLIGTQALLHQDNLGQIALLVVDEQHKFSVQQRSLLCANETHVIEASATPIPRSLALALFNGWTEAKISGYPVEKIIKGHLLDHDQRDKAVLLLKSHLVSGKRVILLYPVVSDKKGNDRSVVAAAKRLELRFPGKVVCLHGKLKPDEKARCLAEFASGHKPIAVSSTVVEVGVDIADIGCMVVNDADRFGVAQLHQLRGRLVRNGGRGDFVMMTKRVPTKSTALRLQAVRDILDGFELAERDMHLRGFGDVLGEMQSGSTSTLFKLARLDVMDFLLPSTQRIQ